MMKTRSLIFTFCFGAIMLSQNIHAQIQLPAASPAASVSTTVGLTEVQINYFRPKVKGRKIFGSSNSVLLPYGSIWRTGANSGTKVSFSDDVVIEGTTIPAGEYLLLSVPGEEEWEVMFYTDLSLGGAVHRYDKSKEIGLFKVKPTMLSEKVEALTFNISDINEDNTRAAIHFEWENTSLKLMFTVDYDKKVMADIEKSTRVNPGTYIAAATYYFNTGRDLEQALKWMDMGLDPDTKQYWNVHTKAKMLNKKGDFSEALAVAEKSLELATTAKDNAYIKMNNALIAEIKPNVPKGKSKKKK